ncbi:MULTISPECIES: hypothetical protein [unclassified Clostridium]|jgi:hypothetical protein|uniref:hypothetical protein n=1 Tax=unclassified Clostridium TaxID=2614128 RepID=UPI0025E7AF33|nr:hypothetical protein [Clostridium sp.]MCI6691843.1 hypothetical protein [Clostridium sp.]MDY2630784.1 hypothetical protein [Clostridium sp.]
MKNIENNKNAYLPEERTGYAPEPHTLISHGKLEGPSSPLPSTVEDPIVVNNISNAEFDYTEQPDSYWINDI